MFKKEIYLQRRKGLQEQLDSGLVVLLGNEESPMNYKDNTYHFRQDSNFLYYVGIDQAHLAVVIDIDEGQTILYGDELTIDHIVWMGPQPSLQELAGRSGIGSVTGYGQLAEKLKAAKDFGRTIHYLPPYRGEEIIKLHQWLNASVDEVQGDASEDLIRAVIAQRAIKTAEEVAELEKAVTISGAMHVAAMKAARAGKKEAELAGIIEGIAIGAGGRLSFPAILTVNGQTLHNHYHGNTLQEGQLVLGDFGAENAMHYAGDITRTYPVANQFTIQQKEIYTIVLKALNDSIEACKPGVPYQQIHLGAAKIIASGLKDLGLMTGDVEEAAAAGAHALFFPHGLGHMLGMDVHDMEGLGEDLVGYDDTVQRSDQFGTRSLRLGRALQPGFVLTVEPGIYFIPELIDLWKAEGKFTDFIAYDKLEAYRSFGGIRIEDDVLITEKGSHVLGKPIPKTVAEVEALRGA
jgi:Xaa-Pro aminopeptidase